ncbi:MAG: glycosyltransferase N-terminal domain-containing protein [Yoonia sp.]|nr:glycosyltransferase N-terminal domain-containing protein [Yoonia sp.]
MPFLIRLWLFASRSLAGPIHALAKYAHRRQGADPNRMQERLGLATKERPKGRLLWVHAASLGEIGQTRDLLERLMAEPDVTLLVTTVSQSGAGWMARECPQITHQFLPLDTPLAVTHFLKHWAPQAAIFVEGDLWPRLLIAANGQDIPLLLLNARPSRSRERNPDAYAFLLAQFRAITCKSAQVMDALTEIGVARDRLHYFGDLRASAPALPVDTSTVTTLKAQIAGRPTWIAASSHAEDEADILTACSAILTQSPDALLIWAPRHPQRAKAIRHAAQGLSVRQRSQSEPIDATTQIYLADTLGELGTLFSCTNIAFLGGAFGPQGGHNPYEPACFGCVVLTGPNHRNHKDGFTALTAVGAAHVVQNGIDLGNQVLQLLSDQHTQARGAQAKQLVSEANGAAEQTAALIVAQLS